MCGRTITYGKREKMIVESGADAIREVLFSEDEERILSLLVCLDGYLDPYYGRVPEYADEITLMLEEMLISGADGDIAFECVELLGYSRIALTLLKENIGKVSEDALPDVKELLSWNC